MRYPQIAQRAFNAPLLVDPAKAQAFLAGFGARVLDGRIILPSLNVPEERADRAARVEPRMSIIGGEVAERRRRDGRALYPVRDGIAIIEATGTMVHRGAWLGNSSGQTSYEGLAAQIEAAAADSSVAGIALEIDTFGGQAAGCFDLADLIRKARAAKPIWAFVAESALSAGYAIASQADRIILPRTGEVGSIGVLTMHVDYSEALSADGISVTLIHAGSHKVDGNPFEPLPAGVREDMTAEVERLRGIFAATVAAGRGRRLSADAALATEARIFSGEQAVAAGLADEVSDLRSAFAALVQKVNHRSPGLGSPAATAQPPRETAMTAPSGRNEKETIMSNDQDNAAPETEDTPETAATDEGQQGDGAGQGAATAEAPAPAPAEAAANITRTAAAELAEVAAQAARLGVPVDLAAELRAGTTPADLRGRVLEKAAAKADAAHVSPARKATPAAGDAPKGESPIVAAARKASEAQVAAQKAAH